MQCCGINVTFDSFCEKVHDIGEMKVVKYGSNIIGVIPIAGSIVGIVRIAAQTLFRKYQEAGLYKDRPVRDNPVKYSEVKLVQGVAELVPLVGPGIFWTCRGIYLGLKACQKCRSSSHTYHPFPPTGSGSAATVKTDSGKIKFPDVD